MCPFSVLVQYPSGDGDEASILWSHHEETREKEIMQGTMPGARRREARKATHGLD